MGLQIQYELVQHRLAEKLAQVDARVVALKTCNQQWGEA